ncbi:hybrid histidine protein kinase/response regulator SinK [Vitiosangium sp. GDMCC 1.1324]|uniref:hybrid histidine protein kinase/response regulator SinK n=1 Tax=Vitiosangium sp. (strain GDMCC 1.1324) TaxID=2138576 RepID=UPI000D3DAEE3|nr:hybrid histidine protein kinase/response regulator SinK [Vitiosangium sp. GDMCC 1.1324]PTL85224.1 hybrid sensor histidine kinase/response regulator [Vitiosangium sp. GDMCC 1.1324]
MDIPVPLAHLLQALEAGDLLAAKAAAAELQRTSAGTTQLAAEVLHELRQPLLGVKAYTQLLSEEIGMRGPLRQMLAQVERMEQIISDFTRLASERPAPQQPVSLVTHVQAAARSFSLNPDSSRVTLQVEAPEDFTLQGNGRLLEQLTLNLLNNARDAVSGPGRVKVVLAREGTSPVMYVADWGPGVPEAVRHRLFEPYVTGSKRGTGLGLAVCRRIAQEHHAKLELVPASLLPDQPPPTTVFRILFPAPGPLPAVPSARASTPSVPDPATTRRRLLVVDDEDIIRSVFKDLMSRECEVLEAANAEEALSHLKREPVDLIVTDKNLPGLSGLELAQQARRLDPSSRVILMTGYPSLVTAQQALELGLLDYLLKPFDDIREVRAKLREALTSAVPVRRGLRPGSRRVDVLDDSPASARHLTEALASLGLEARVLSTAPEEPAAEPPAAVVVSWDFGPAYGRQALELARKLGQGAPFVVLAEYLSQETMLEALRAGASGCLPRELQARELSHELSRLLMQPPSARP